MNKMIGLTAVFLTLCNPLICQSQDFLNDSIIKELKKAVEGFKDRYHSPGIVVAIVHNKDIVFSESLGYIDVENKVPATVDSKFPILSVTKTFTATMLMQLVERKRLSLQDDVRKYVPEYREASKSREKGETTLFQLATHTSGLPRNSPADIGFTKQVDQWIIGGIRQEAILSAGKKEFLQSLRLIQREYPPYELLSYEDRHYSNLGYSLLGIALERASKNNYQDYVLNNICKPLKMGSTGFDTENAGKNDMAKGYFYNDSLRDFIETPVYRSNSAIYAGGMYSTARDLANYLSFQFDNSAEAVKVLSSESKAMMYAMKIGWKASYPFVLHEGAMLGYRCQIAFSPDLKIGWIILTNTTEFQFSRINEYISKLILPVYKKNQLQA
jgi:CubicO group peptidase (beta-lactamase class C family)